MDISQRETNSAVHNSSIYYLAQTAPLYQAVPHTPPPTIAIRKSSLKTYPVIQTAEEEKPGSKQLWLLHFPTPTINGFGDS